MQDNEKLINIEKEIKGIYTELDDVAVQLGGVFLDEGQTLEKCSLIGEIESLEKSIPEIKGDMIRLQGYTQHISESQEQIEVCNQEIKDYESSINSLNEKIGIELYGSLTDEDLLNPSIKNIYRSLKSLEKRSEELESKMYKHENSVAKKKFIDIALSPFRIGSIKKDIKKNNRDILLGFRELGKYFTSDIELLEKEKRDSLNDLVNEYHSVFKLLNGQIEKRALLNSGIEEKNRKIQEDSKGVKLKTLYSNLEKDIITCQKMITEKLKELGYHLFKEFGISHNNNQVKEKLKLFNEVNNKLKHNEELKVFYSNRIKLSLLKREAANREESIKLEEDHIKECRKKLTKHKKDLSGLFEEILELENWLGSNSKTSE